jgi:hypothetical protein
LHLAPFLGIKRQNKRKFNVTLFQESRMKPIFSIFHRRHSPRLRVFLVAAIAGTGIFASLVADAKEPFTAFNYAASPVLTTPGQGSPACMETGAPTCPSEHVCDYFGYSGAGVGKPGFGKTTIDVCIKKDLNLGVQNATGGNCAQSSGFEQITYQIRPHSQKVIVLGLLGQTCDVQGAATASLLQNMAVTQGPWSGNLSISSLDTDGLKHF